MGTAVCLGSDQKSTELALSLYETTSFSLGTCTTTSPGPFTPLLLHESLHRPQKLYEGTTRDGGASKTIWYKHKRRKQLLHPCGPASIPVYVAAQSERGSPDLCHAWSAIRSDQPILLDNTSNSTTVLLNLSGVSTAAQPRGSTRYAHRKLAPTRNWC